MQILVKLRAAPIPAIVAKSSGAMRRVPMAEDSALRQGKGNWGKENQTVKGWKMR